MADARAQLLPLVGNGDRLHDWAEIFGRWKTLPMDTHVAAKLSAFACVGAVFAWVWLLMQWRNRNLN